MAGQPTARRRDRRPWPWLVDVAEADEKDEADDDVEADQRDGRCAVREPARADDRYGECGAPDERPQAGRAATAEPAVDRGRRDAGHERGEGHFERADATRDVFADRRLDTEDLDQGPCRECDEDGGQDDDEMAAGWQAEPMRGAVGSDGFHGPRVRRWTSSVHQSQGEWGERVRWTAGRLIGGCAGSGLAPSDPNLPDPRRPGVVRLRSSPSRPGRSPQKTASSSVSITA